MQDVQQIIEQAWEDRANLNPGSSPARVGEAVDQVLTELDSGRLRVAEKIDGQWVTNQWVKKAVLISFRLEDNHVMDGGVLRYYDKVPTKFAQYDDHRFRQGGFRVVPGAVVPITDLLDWTGRPFISVFGFVCVFIIFFLPNLPSCPLALH